MNDAEPVMLNHLKKAAKNSMSIKDAIVQSAILGQAYGANGQTWEELKMTLIRGGVIRKTEMDKILSDFTTSPEFL